MLVSDPLQKMVSPLLATDHALTRLGPIEQHRHGPVAGWSDADEPYLFEEPLALGRSSNAASCAGVGPVKHPSLCFFGGIIRFFVFLGFLQEPSVGLCEETSSYAA